MKAYVSEDLGPVSAWRQWTSLHANSVHTGPSDPMAKWTWQASNTGFNSAQNIGQYYAGDAGFGGIATRGGSWSIGSTSGIYTLLMSSGSGTAEPWTGFRCVYRSSSVT
jgi:hypothetical protein